MSVSKQITIWCENCSKWEMDSGISVRAFRKDLKAKGWSSKRRDGLALDYCPQCTQITQMYTGKRRSG